VRNRPVRRMVTPCGEEVASARPRSNCADRKCGARTAHQLNSSVVVWSCGRVVVWSCGRVVVWSPGLSFGTWTFGSWAVAHAAAGLPNRSGWPPGPHREVVCIADQGDVFAVSEAVMERAPQHEEVHVGGSVFGTPLLNVVDLTPFGRDMTIGHPAAAVAYGEGAPVVVAGQALCPAEIEWNGVVHQDSGDVRVPDQTTHRLGGDHVTT
jgi:hypothetical protein